MSNRRQITTEKWIKNTLPWKSTLTGYPVQSEQPYRSTAHPYLSSLLTPILPSHPTSAEHVVASPPTILSQPSGSYKSSVINPVTIYTHRAKVVSVGVNCTYLYIPA